MNFSTYTERARKVIQLAHDFACEIGHNYIGSEHILLGILNEGSGKAAKALDEAGVTEDKIREAIETAIGSGKAFSVDTPLSLTPRTKRILDIALFLSRSLGHNYIGTEHILMAIIREGDSVATSFLLNEGVDLEEMYNSLAGSDNSDGYEKPSSAKSTNRQNRKRNGKTPTLDKFGRDFTQLASEGKFDPVIGRAKEIDRVLQILSRRTKNNPCLTGEPGVGKSAIIEGLAQKIVAGDVPEPLKNKRIVSLDLSSMVAGTKYRGEFEERIKKALDEVLDDENTILFIDEIHTIVGAGASEGSLDASNILKPLLARGELQLIGATTIK